MEMNLSFHKIDTNYRAALLLFNSLIQLTISRTAVDYEPARSLRRASLVPITALK